jgi:hypothetical protein
LLLLLLLLHLSHAESFLDAACMTVGAWQCRVPNLRSHSVRKMMLGH